MGNPFRFSKEYTNNMDIEEDNNDDVDDVEMNINSNVAQYGNHHQFQYHPPPLIQPSPKPKPNQNQNQFQN